MQLNPDSKLSQNCKETIFANEADEEIKDVKEIDLNCYSSIHSKSNMKEKNDLDSSNSK